MVQDIWKTNKLEMQDKATSRTRQRCKTCCGHTKSSKCKRKKIKAQDQGTRNNAQIVQDKQHVKGTRLDIGFKGASQRCKSKVQDT